MSSHFLFHTEDSQFRTLDIDKLCEKQRKRDMQQVTIFNTILNRLQKRIETGAHKTTCKYIWFTVPVYIVGQPLYEKTDCVAYIVNKLTENGFDVRVYSAVHLFVSWTHWVPSHVRAEIRKRHGVQIDSFGNIKDAVDPVAALNQQQSLGKKNATPSTKAHVLQQSLVYKADVVEDLERHTQEKTRSMK
jgi:hypothetical protein